MRILTVIPARGGSKGIPRKNIYPLCGRPLIEYTLECAIDSGIDMDIAVSSDSDEILDVAKKYERIICIKRPDNISSDTAGTEAALIHALRYMKECYNREYDAVITLQATSPLRKPETLRDFVLDFGQSSENYDAMLTLHENRADHWIRLENGEFRRLYPDAPRRRQEREPLYIEDSCIYITKTDALEQTGSVLGTKTYGYSISEEEGMDINEFLDIIIVEGIIKNKGIKSNNWAMKE